jgi:hypothetical protein
MALLSKTPRKQAPLNIYLRVLTIRNHPNSPAFMRVEGVLQGRRSGNQRACTKVWQHAQGKFQLSWRFTL